jgi:hypothetical protein
MRLLWRRGHSGRLLLEEEEKIQKPTIVISGTTYNEAEKREPQPWRTST